MPKSVRVSGSLRNRLMITSIGGTAILAVLLYFVVRDYASQIAQRGQDSVLAASVTSILDTALIRDGIVEVDFPYGALSMLTTPSDDRVFYAIYQDDTLLSGYDELTVNDISVSGGNVFRSIELGGVEMRQATATRTLIGADVRTRILVSVAQTQDVLSATLNRISITVAFLGFVFFVLAALLSVWATSTTIGPLRRLTTSVTRRGPQDLSPVTQPVPSEMVPLVSSLNKLMSRLDQSLVQSEDFIAEAAHRVRTPLATVRSYAEATLQRVDDQENRQALRSMIRALDESSRAASQLLDHAMITFRADQMEKTELDLVALVRELVLRLQPIAELKDVDLEVHADEDVTIMGDAILVQNAVRNLIDNALKYTASESRIDIVVTASPSPRVQVLDQGNGFAANEIKSLTGRFTRGSNSEGIIGSGLGLTIARDVARAHSGSLKMSNHESGGACVTLQF